VSWQIRSGFESAEIVDVISGTGSDRFSWTIRTLEQNINIYCDAIVTTDICLNNICCEIWYHYHKQQCCALSFPSLQACGPHAVAK